MTFGLLLFPHVSGAITSVFTHTLQQPDACRRLHSYACAKPSSKSMMAHHPNASKTPASVSSSYIWPGRSSPKIKVTCRPAAGIQALASSRTLTERVVEMLTIATDHIRHMSTRACLCAGPVDGQGGATRDMLHEYVRCQGLSATLFLEGGEPHADKLTGGNVVCMTCSPANLDRA